jgi:PAS domain S-box-containing protein
MIRRRRLTRTIAWRAAAAAVLLAVIAGVATQSLLLGIILAFAGIVIVLVAIDAPLRRIRRNLGALVDGVSGFADNDFSLRLHVTGNDEITELVSIYNGIGNVLRAQRNESLQRELLFETVLQASPLAMLLTDDQRRIVFVNRAARDLLGGAERLEGRRIDDVAADVPALADAAPTSLFTAGSETYQLTRRTFYINAREHVLWLIARLTQQLRRQEIDVWKRAIRVVSHELNNSLAPVHSLFHSARVVRERGDDAARLEEINSAIAERLESLQKFIDGYAEFARLPKPRRAPVGWRELLERVQTIVPFTIGEPLPPQPACVDRAQLEQVLINLVKNAAEADSSDTCVRVIARDGGAALIVEDRGRGMDDATIARAVLPFYSTRPGGTGLGLAVVSEIVDAHGGNVRIAQREGGGTTVTCWLPRNVEC